MVELQDIANIALVVAVVFNIVQFLYGPLAKRRGSIRDIKKKVLTELGDAKTAAKSPEVSGRMGNFQMWEKEGHRLPGGIRGEVAAFKALCDSYWPSYLHAQRLVHLAIYESMAERPHLPRGPKAPPEGPKDWIVKGSSGSRTSRESLEKAFIEVLTQPLLEGREVRWSWLEDRESEFTQQLLKAIDRNFIDDLLEGIKGKVHHSRAEIQRLREIKWEIREYRFRHLRIEN